MRIGFLGVGGAFEPEFGSAAAIAETGEGTVTLIDCGCTTYLDLKHTGWIDKITHILITHLHDDHVGSLGSVIYHHFHLLNRKVELLFPPHLRAPLLTLIGLQHTQGPADERVLLHELRDDLSGSGDMVGSTYIQWIDTTGYHQEGMPSSGYIFRDDKGIVAYSGDLGDPDLIFKTLESGNIQEALVLHDIFFQNKPGGPHAYYKDVEIHADRWTIRGYHNNPTRKPADCKITLAFEDPELILTNRQD